MAAIRKALDECKVEHSVFYVNEVDIHLNPTIGTDLQQREQRKRMVTSGQIQKYHLTGALHSCTEKINYVDGSRKWLLLFINLLNYLDGICQLAKTITLIVDNYIIHMSENIRNELKANSKFKMIYQPFFH